MQTYDLIQPFFSHKSTNANIKLSVGDDAAIIYVPEQFDLTVSIDTLVCGVHAPEATSPEDKGKRK